RFSAAQLSATSAVPTLSLHDALPIFLFFTKGHADRQAGTPCTKEVWYYEHRLPEGQKAYNKTRPLQLKEFDPIKAWWNNRKESEDRKSTRLNSSHVKISYAVFCLKKK